MLPLFSAVWIVSPLGLLTFSVTVLCLQFIPWILVESVRLMDDWHLEFSSSSNYHASFQFHKGIVVLPLYLYLPIAFAWLFCIWLLFSDLFYFRNNRILLLSFLPYTCHILQTLYSGVYRQYEIYLNTAYRNTRLPNIICQEL